MADGMAEPLPGTGHLPRARFEAGLWFSYGKGARPSLETANTYDALVAGERRSTTRFLAWPGHNMWAGLKPGHAVMFRPTKVAEGDTRRALVLIDSVEPINLATCDDATLEEWSLHEGWLAARGRQLGGVLGPALWLRHTLLWHSPQPAPPMRQLSLF